MFTSEGQLQWGRFFTGSCDLFGTGVEATSDGGCIALGGNTSALGRVIRLDAAGTVLWDKGYKPDDGAKCVPWDIEPSLGGGLAVIGICTGSHSQGEDAWIQFYSDDGFETGSKRLGGTGKDSIRRIRRLPTGGFLLVGATTSSGAGGWDGWILKFGDDFQTQCQ
jgi:hypothetical protein